MERRLIVICGPPCSGKSVVAAWLENEHRLPQLEMDSIREQLFPVGSNTPEERQLSYDAMHVRARHLFGDGISWLSLVATYQPWQRRQDVALFAKEFNALITLIQLRVNPNDAVRRFRDRSDNHAARDLTEDRVQDLAAKYAYLRSAPIIDTSSATTAEVRGAVARVMGLVEADNPHYVTPELLAEWIETARKLK